MNRFSKTILGILLAVLLVDLSCRWIVDWLWFQEVAYLEIFQTRRATQFGLSGLVLLVSLLFFWGNFSLAAKQQWFWVHRRGWVKNSLPYLTEDKLSAASSQNQFLLSSASSKNLAAKKDRYFAKKLKQKIKDQNTAAKPGVKLPLLLSMITVAIALITYFLVYYSDLTLEIWQQKEGLNVSFDGLQTVFHSARQTRIGLIKEYWWLILPLGAIANLLLTKTQLALKLIAIYFSLILALLVAGNWINFLAFLQPTSFNYSDPQFGRDISFYIFDLPLIKVLYLWLNGLFSVSLLLAFLQYLLSANSLSEGRFPGFSPFQIHHLSLLTGMMMLSVAFKHWLNRYELLFSTQGVVYGAGYRELVLQLPLETILVCAAIAIALWLFWLCFAPGKYALLNKLKTQQKKIRLVVLLPIVLYLLLLVSGTVASDLVQHFLVQPNELISERPFLTRNIALTRKAFNLEDIDAKTFDPQGELDSIDIAKNTSTIDNIRLWDTRPILETNRQLQQIRLYYEFLDADIDRYSLQAGTKRDKQQVIISARELDYNSVPETAKTWVNKHLVYTHGYGFTLSPVNQVDEGGLPFYYVKDIGTASQQTGSLNVSSQEIRDSIPLENPRIYYGEMTDNYIMTDTRVQELDYPRGEENAYNVYDGLGGISIGNYGSRLLFAEYLRDWQMLFTRNFNADTKLLLRRNITHRVSRIAPWLRYDKDPYLVVADTSTENTKQSQHLYWILDAYTISDLYPYSDPGENSFNYIRNSVKVTIDAYNGDVKFYIADPTDPIINTWNKVFPNLLQPISAMPDSLRSHIRYPEDLFSIQSERLLTYHMTNPQVFYNREDQWQIPQEIYGAEAQPVDPYYLIMRLPTAKKEEFILLHPYTPTSRPNLIAWLAARSDGDQYGKLLLYRFPKQKLVYGSKQIEALINQDPVISQQISLWNREGSRAIQGNLLIIPIEQSLLYVEPLYIEAEQNSLPALARVIVVYENRIVMAETLQEAIAAIFQPNSSDSAAIIRPVESVE